MKQMQRLAGIYGIQDGFTEIRTTIRVSKTEVDADKGTKTDLGNHSTGTHFLGDAAKFKHESFRAYLSR